MARIKQVMNERRLAYDQAVKLHQDGVTLEQLDAAEAEKSNDVLVESRTGGMLEAEPEPEATQSEGARSVDKPNPQ
jgi:hypothetical protein